ncbi:MAG: nitroreductase family protein [Chloroflexi bacterium]|nr:nitroreductase family protein [Chloroflexota bacterium]
MNAFETVQTVLAVRAFQDKPVPTEVKNRILEAARLTGSGSNHQPWHFILIENRAELQQLGAVARTGPYTAQAAFAVVVIIERSPIALSDGSRAIQSMLLTAWADGVGSNWVGFVPMPEVSKLLDIPDTLDVLAILPFGYPTKDIGQGKKNRKAPEEVFHIGKFGNPYAPK